MWSWWAPLISGARAQPRIRRCAWRNCPLSNSGAASPTKPARRGRVTQASIRLLSYTPLLRASSMANAAKKRTGGHAQLKCLSSRTNASEASPHAFHRVLDGCGRLLRVKEFKSGTPKNVRGLTSLAYRAFCTPLRPPLRRPRNEPVLADAQQPSPWHAQRKLASAIAASHR